MNKTPTQTLVSTIAGLGAVGARFASFTYTAKGTGEIAQHTVALGVSLENAYKRDVKILEAKLPALTGVSRDACIELLASLRQSLEKGIGNNDAYTCAQSYVTVAPGVKLHVENGELHVYGFSIGKKVLAEGVRKSVNSSAKTIAKNKLKKGLKTGKFRQFALGALEVAKLQGKTLVFG